MSGLLESLTTASNSLLAQRMGLDLAGQNMANINTPGYSRRSLVLAEVPPTDLMNAGRGVTVVGIRALRDQLVEARLRREQSDTAHDAALMEILATVEAAAGMPGQSLDAQLTAFFDAFSALATDPTSAVARDTVVREGRSLTRAFGDLVTQFTGAQQDADLALRAGLEQVNRLTTEIAGLNVDMANASYDVETIRDRQGLLLSQLSELTDIAVLPRDDGGVDVTLSSGRALILGGNSYPLAPSQSALAQISLGDVDVTADITGGRLAGFLQARDSVIPGYTARMDQLAYDIATAINAVHSTGFDGTGAAAGNFFTAPAAVAGAALALSVDPGVVADSARVAASATGAVGDNAIARMLAAMRDQPIADANSRSVFASWSQLVYSVGADSAAARAAESSHSQVVTQLEQLRAQASGVSYDEETAQLMRYQRAYEANARYFTTILDTLDVLMEMVR